MNKDYFWPATEKPMNYPPTVDIIIPAFNEEESIGRVIKEIPAGLVRNVIVCNNNSTDNTSRFAREAGAIVIDQPQRGYGIACLSGINYIREMKTADQPDIVIFMDGDYSDYPDEISKLIEHILKGNDMVIGSRVAGKYQKGSLTTTQIFGNWLATNLIRIFYGFRYTDLGPFRAIRWLKLLELNMEDKDFGWTVEMQIKALKHKFNCTEIPVSYRKRIGKSKISGTVRGSILAGHKILLTVFRLI